jgi:uncharacterized lipoprotein
VRDWVQPSVLDVEQAKIKSVSVEIPNEAPLRIEREAAGKFKLVSIPDGKKLKQGTDVDAIARAVGSIELEDVRKPEQASGEVSTARFETDGGLAVVLRLRKDGEDTWLTISASGEGEAKTQAEEISRRSKDWEFKIPTYKASAILKRPADLFEAS